MRKIVLTLNAGSSSIKFALFDTSASEAGDPQRICHGQIASIGSAPYFLAKADDGTTLVENSWANEPQISYDTLLSYLLDWVKAHLGDDTLQAVGHRIVHGGPHYSGPIRLDAHIRQDLGTLIPLAPLHQPHNLIAADTLARLHPALLQVACFDTAFHHGMSPVAKRYALPRKYTDAGVHRYGFHGLSYEYIAGRLRHDAPQLADGRVIVAHLGNGASLCAMRAGRSVDTTMGFTPLDGLVMGTRCGNLDPGIVLYLQRQYGLSISAIEHMLYNESGLLGVSGVSNNMHALLDSDDAHAREAIDLFVYRVAREVGALTSSLGGLDALIFTAGIGEHAARIRAAVCQRLAWLGLAFDERANTSHASVISAAHSRVEVRIIPTDEEAVIASQTARFIDTATPASLCDTNG